MGDFAAAAAAGRASTSADELTRAERTQAARSKHTQSLRAMAESLNVARETAHSLSIQSGELPIVCYVRIRICCVLQGWLGEDSACLVIYCCCFKWVDGCAMQSTSVYECGSFRVAIRL